MDNVLNDKIVSIVVAYELDMNRKHCGVAQAKSCASHAEDKAAVFDDLLTLAQSAEGKQIMLSLRRDEFGDCVVNAEDGSGTITEYKSIQIHHDQQKGQSMNNLWDRMEEFMVIAACILIIIAIIFMIVQTILIFQMLLKM